MSRCGFNKFKFSGQCKQKFYLSTIIYKKENFPVLIILFFWTSKFGTNCDKLIKFKRFKRKNNSTKEEDTEKHIKH